MIRGKKWKILKTQKKEIQIQIQIKKSAVQFSEESSSFKYTDIIDNKLSKLFEDFGAFKDYESLIKTANIIYDENDGVQSFIKLLSRNEKLQNLILSKKSEQAQKQISLERVMLKKLEEEKKEEGLGKYIPLLELSEDTGTFYIGINFEADIIKLSFSKELSLDIGDAFKLIRLFYEVESYPAWIPSIEHGRVEKSLSKGKKCFHVKFSLPIIQERDLLIYQFVNNRMKEKRSIQFIAKSYDNEPALKDFIFSKKR